MTKRALAMLALGVLLPLRTRAEDPPTTNPRPALPFPPGIRVQEVCGPQDESQHVEFYDGALGVTKEYVKDHEPSTIQLQWVSAAVLAQKLPGYSPGNVVSERWCTGTLISESRVLTAGHCLDAQDGQDGWISPFKLGANGKPEYAAPGVLATLQVANFRYQKNKATGAIRTPDVFPVVGLVEHRRGDLDYAIVQLGPDSKGEPPSKYFQPATVLTRAPANQELIAVIQHPQGDPKKIEAGHVLQASGAALYYGDLDTHGGSSGSGVRDHDGLVIGVHTNGGCTTTGGANRGVTTNAIGVVSDVF